MVKSTRKKLRMKKFSQEKENFTGRRSLRNLAKGTMFTILRTRTALQTSPYKYKKKHLLSASFIEKRAQRADLIFAQIAQTKEG